MVQVNGTRPLAQRFKIVREARRKYWTFCFSPASGLAAATLARPTKGGVSAAGEGGNGKSGIPVYSLFVRHIVKSIVAPVLGQFECKGMASAMPRPCTSGWALAPEVLPQRLKPCPSSSEIFKLTHYRGSWAVPDSVARVTFQNQGKRILPNLPREPRKPNSAGRGRQIRPLSGSQ